MVLQLVHLPYERGGREGWSKLQLAEWRKTMFGYVLTIKDALRIENYSSPELEGCVAAGASVSLP